MIEYPLLCFTDLCSEKPIGCQNYYIIPNPAFTQWQALEERQDPFRARLNAGLINDIYHHGVMETSQNIPGGWVHYYDSCCDFGVQLDLGIKKIFSFPLWLLLCFFYNHILIFRN